jgi:DNA-binding SARP family transcriptional activator
MPDTLRIGLLGPLQVRDEAGRTVHVGGRQLRVLLILLALEPGRVVPSGSLAGQIWADEPPANPGNALQTLISRLRAELRRAGLVVIPRCGSCGPSAITGCCAGSPASRRR